MSLLSETKKRKWVVTMEVEVEVPEHFEADTVRETMTRQMDNITFGGNLFWEVTERRVVLLARQRGRFW